MPDLRALALCYNAPINHNLILNQVVEPNGPSNSITSGVSTLTAPVCHTLKEYSWELFHMSEKVICKASSRACVAPVFHWNVNGINIDKDMIINPQIAVSVNDLTTPINLKTSIMPVPIVCNLKHTTSTQDNFMLTLTPDSSFIGHFPLTINLSSSDPVSTPNPATVEVNMERLFIDWSGDTKRCLDDTIHYLDHRIVADPRLELVKSFLEPSLDYAHVLTKLREIMKVLKEVSEAKPEAAKELVAKITEMLNITPKELNAFLPE